MLFSWMHLFMKLCPIAFLIVRVSIGQLVTHALKSDKIVLIGQNTMVPTRLLLNDPSSNLQARAKTDL